MSNIYDEYFNWLCDSVKMDVTNDPFAYGTLMHALHDTIFYYSIPRDKNRAEDGIDMRYRFANVYGYDYKSVERCFNECSVLEMMVALAVRCEGTIMDDPSKGDRTGQWFWIMVRNLGLDRMTNRGFDDDKFSYTIDRFLRREYEPNGRGGLFRVEGCGDLRKVEIWHQLCWYLNKIV